MSLLQIRLSPLVRAYWTSAMPNASSTDADSAMRIRAASGLASPMIHTVIYEDDALRVTAVSIAIGTVEQPRRHRLPSVFAMGFYEMLSSGSIEGSFAGADDPNGTTLLETDVEVAVGWPDVLETWKDATFGSFEERSDVIAKLATKVRGSIAYVADLERGRGKTKSRASFAFSALGTGIGEKREGKWLIVHHQAGKEAAHLTR
jgi:hypothetical protein